jgi:predicted AlkP superfamily phosphohydrolase/phosphomutase
LRVITIGLDSEPPALWDEFADVMPTISRLRVQGVFLPLASTDPPITVPAWISMLSGRDPGELGIYGFRNRAAHDYGSLATANAASVRVPRVWDVLTAHGLRSAVVGVPGTYPPSSILGVMVGDFLTPPGAVYTSPPAFAQTVERVVGGAYAFDVEGFRSHDLARIRDDAFLMTQRRFDLVRHIMGHEDWQFLMMHEIGLDRVHHAFWNHFDERHPLYVPDSPYRDVVRNYHRFIDRQIGALLEQAPRDSAVFIVSDHGSRPMAGGVYLNDWLRAEGLLTLKAEPAPDTRFTLDLVDWGRTRAWAEGGYYGRIFFNVAGREPEGVVAPAAVDALAARIRAGLEGLRCGAEVVRPANAYRRVEAIAPDLMVYLGSLGWRALASVGHEDIYTLANDTGPDGANHDRLGVFLAWSPDGAVRTSVTGEASILDVAATLLRPFGLDGAVPGEPIVEVTPVA